MRFSRVSAAAGLAAATVLLPAASVFAAGNVNTIEVTPGTVAPGGTATASISMTTCPKDSTFTATEQNNGWKVVLTKGTMSLVGTLSVPSTAKAGSYTLVGSCPTGGTIVSGSFNVSGSTPTSTPAPTVTATAPVGAVKTGLGGSVNGGSTTETAIGAALAAATVAGGVVLLRRRRTRTDS